jgi:hypothetical protein
MLKTVKGIHQTTQQKVILKSSSQSSPECELETTMSDLSNIDTYPETKTIPKIDLDLYQLEASE